MEFIRTSFPFQPEELGYYEEQFTPAPETPECWSCWPWIQEPRESRQEWTEPVLVKEEGVRERTFSEEGERDRRLYCTTEVGR